jgi:acetyl esterase/lipase
MADTMAARGAVRVEDVAYHRDGDTTLLARLYRPAGTGPFPVLIDLHGGAWTSGDRLQNVAIAEVLAKAGILVVSLDFRMPPAKRYPATLDDIDAGIGWTRKHAADYGGRPDWVGGFGTSSGGHLILLAAMRPKSPEARLAYVISGWGVLDPLLRYRLAQERGAQNFIAAHHAFWGDEAAMSDGSPPLMLQRGEKVEMPPALIFQGTDDEWVPQAMTKDFVAAYRHAGGEIELELLPGAKHSFFRDDATGPNAQKAIAVTRDYVLKRTKGS